MGALEKPSVVPFSNVGFANEFVPAPPITSTLSTSFTSAEQG
jgi:hypothetical protein